MVTRIMRRKSWFLTGIFACFTLASQHAHAIPAPTLTFGGPSGSLTAGAPETFGCNSGPGVLAKGTVEFYVIGAGGGTGSVNYSNGSGSVQYTFPSLAAGTYEAYCEDSGAYSNIVHFTIAAAAGAQGLVYPKYVVVGVTYAPPGPSSYVQYAGTTSIGNTTTISNSFSNDAGFSVSVKTGAGFSGFGPSGSLTVTSSTDYTQGSNSSTTTTISKQTALTYKTTGTGNAFSPVDHDYDTIWLWLNPIAILNITPATPATKSTQVGIQWNGFGFDTDDPSGKEQPDVYPVLVGWLNGHFGSNSSINTVLARSWQSTANGYVWASGQGPGLTGIGNPTAGTDVASILASDPLTSSSYSLLDSFPSTTSDGRFTIMEGSQTPNPIPYEQAGLGNGGGINTMYSVTQTDTQSVAKGNSSSTKQAFSVQQAFGEATWLANLKIILTESDTLTWTNTWLNTLTTTTTLQDSLSVTGPPCPATTAPCNPEYTGPGQFLIYQDNQFGTFLFYPSN